MAEKIVGRLIGLKGHFRSVKTLGIVSLFPTTLHQYTALCDDFAVAQVNKVGLLILSLGRIGYAMQ